MNFERISKRQWLVIASISIVCLGGILYGHTMNAPFYYDDIISLVDEPVHHRDLSYSFNNIFQPRGIANLTFGLNYHFGGLDPAGYHMVNIVIHILTSFVIFGILLLIVPDSPGMALTGALIFQTHPLQTQSVTYVVQRYTSLSALFLFCAILLFCHACQRLSREGSSSAVFISLYLTALACGTAAVYTKQNAAVLPILLLLAMYLIVDRQIHIRKRVFLVMPFFVAPLHQMFMQVALPIINRSGGTTTTATISSLSQAGNAEVAAATPLTYLATEFGVIWLYIRLLFLPVKQALIYNYPMAKSFLDIKSMVALSGIILLLAVAFAIRKKHALIACGIIWFFAGLAVESTLIPLDPIFEHRLYVSLFGFALVVIGLLRMIPSKRNAYTAGIVLVGIYGILTWQRNALWNDPIAFYEDNLKRAPDKVWLYMALGTLYLEHKQYSRAETFLKKAIELRPDYFKGYNNLATLFDLTGRPELALEAYKRAASIDPLDAKVHTNMGAVFAGQKKWNEAIAQHRMALSIKPEYALAHYNLGVALYSNGNRADALKSFRYAVALAPRDEDALYNYALVSSETGDLNTARQSVSQLTALNPERGARLAAEIAAMNNGRHGRD